MYRRSIEQSDVIVTKATEKYVEMMSEVEVQYATLLKQLTAQVNSRVLFLNMRIIYTAINFLYHPGTLSLLPC